MAKRRESESGKERRAAAEQLAIAALGFISGIGPEAIRQAAREPHFLAGVLDHVAADETLLVAFAAQHEVDPDAVMRARDELGGLWERDMP